MSEEIKDRDTSEETKKISQIIKDSPPLFLPVGSVRAILALGLIGISGLLMTQGVEVPEWLYSSVVMILGFYFGARNGKNK